MTPRISERSKRASSGIRPGRYARGLRCPPGPDLLLCGNRRRGRRPDGDDAAPITSVIAANVRRLRTKTRLSGPVLARRLEDEGSTGPGRRSRSSRPGRGTRSPCRSCLRSRSPPTCRRSCCWRTRGRRRRTDHGRPHRLRVGGAAVAHGSGTIDRSDLDNFTSAGWWSPWWAIVETLAKLQKRESDLEAADPTSCRPACPPATTIGTAMPSGDRYRRRPDRCGRRSDTAICPRDTCGSGPPSWASTSRAWRADRWATSATAGRTRPARARASAGR